MIATAKAVALETELARRRIKLKRVGRELVGPCPVCGGRDRFAVNVPKQIWNCRGCAKGGDVIALVQHLDNCDFGAALDTLAGGRHFPIRISTPSPPRRTISSSSIPPSASTANIENSDNDYEQRQREKAEWLWAQRQSIEGSIAERYLREARRYAGPPPATLGYLPARNGNHPAMIAAFALAQEPEPGILAARDIVEAVHLTLLAPDGSGKADVEKPKRVVASPRGLPIVLAPMNDLMGLAICEGIEDALAVHQATGLGAWAAGSAPFLPKLVAAVEQLAAREYDASPGCITIFVDDDAAGRCHARELAADLAALSAKLANDKRPHFEILLRKALP